MKIGYFLPQMGTAASGEAMVKVAQKAEELGFETVWTTERLLFPEKPRTPYAGSPDGVLPDVYRIVYDPLDSLTWVAAQTKRIRLGTSVLDIPYYNPVMLARRLTTIDVLSGGRLTVGMGLGWSEDEYEASGASMRQKGKRADEFLEVLHAIWKNEVAEYSGQYYKLARSTILPKPVQKPHPPVLLAAFSPGALSRIARLADGWNPVGLPLDAVRGMWEGVRGMAKEAGRNPDDLKIVYRANLMLTDEPLGEGRWPFSGSAAEIKQDVKAFSELNLWELTFDASFSSQGSSVGGFLSVMEQVRETVG